MYFYEFVSGARMHAAYYRPVFGNRVMPLSMVDDLLSFIQCFPTTLSEINSVLANNKIWKSRLVNLGCISLKSLEVFGISGILARSVGCKTDLRVGESTSYCLYGSTQVKSYLSENGDCYDRYNLRMFEMLESSNIVNNVVSDYFLVDSFSTVGLGRYGYMEDTISKFKL